MTLDEAIKIEENIAEENQRVVDTGIVFDDVTIDMLYCDDTEVIEEHLANYQRCAEERRQLAEWLKDYKRLLEQEPCDDCIRREDALMALTGEYTDSPIEILPKAIKRINALPSVTPSYNSVKTELEPCADAISRQAVLNLAKFDGRDGLGSIIHAFDVEQLPPVTPTEKMGQIGAEGSDKK